MRTSRFPHPACVCQACDSMVCGNECD
jgi:hypothetical protein